MRSEAPGPVLGRIPRCARNDDFKQDSLRAENRVDGRTNFLRTDPAAEALEEGVDVAAVHPSVPVHVAEQDVAVRELQPVRRRVAEREEERVDVAGVAGAAIEERHVDRAAGEAYSFFGRRARHCSAWAS